MPTLPLPTRVTFESTRAKLKVSAISRLCLFPRVLSNGHFHAETKTWHRDKQPALKGSMNNLTPNIIFPLAGMYTEGLVCSKYCVWMRLPCGFVRPCTLECDAWEYNQKCVQDRHTTWELFAGIILLPLSNMRPVTYPYPHPHPGHANCDWGVCGASLQGLLRAFMPTPARWVIGCVSRPWWASSPFILFVPISFPPFLPSDLPFPASTIIAWGTFQCVPVRSPQVLFMAFSLSNSIRFQWDP